MKIKETIEFAQDLNALMKGMEEDFIQQRKRTEEKSKAWFGKGKKGGVVAGIS